ncbi:hypothetical protein HK105_201448 [Polyrhizophydium stewartii]|uniref:CRAL-TRIO domain-containing protein n=1 Tax=Polyrhizophydium stewartii TaxID=2732419 RepID=A0ABR4NI20_9FUNG
MCPTWRQNLRVPTLLAESFSDLDSTGKLQFWGTALDRSPVLVWTGSRHAPTRTDADMDREMRYILYTLERARHSGLLKDKVTVIVDRHGMRTDKADVRLATTLAPVLQNHYPERLSRMYIFPTNTLFWMLWKVASLSLDPATIPKIHIRESPGPLAEWVSRENLFVRYGGLGVDPFDQPERAETPASGAGPTATSPEAQDAMRASHESGGARASTDSLKRPTDSTASRADSVHRASSTAIGSAAKVAAGIGGMLSSRAATLKRAVTKSDKPLVTIENVWEAPAEFQEV